MTSRIGHLRQFVLDVQNNSAILDGALSLDYGFLPRTLPKQTLPGPFRPWDALAARLPALNSAAAARTALATLPLLDASDPAALPDDCLARAATILSQFALSWWRGEPERFFALRMCSIDPELPDAIRIPWQQVTQRLGRGHEPYQSGYDLFLNNFQLQGGPHPATYPISALTIETLAPLVPTFGNSAERVFYMAFVEMMAHCAPLIEAVCRLEELMTAPDPQPQPIAEILGAITDVVTKCTATFRKINPRVGSATWCDPLLWAKTVAILAVFPHPWRQGGTSGSFVPVFLTLDELLGRTSYHSYYGKYLKEHGPGLLPPHLLEFNRTVGALNFRSWLSERRHMPGFDNTVRAFDALVEAYAGESGYFGRHVSKVLNYLAVATMVGRNQSTSGDERFTHEHTWVQVATRLNAARQERHDLRLTPPVTETRPLPEEPEDMPAFTELEVAASSLSDRPLHVIHGRVYDLNPYLDRHPGGIDIITCYAGLDATPFFSLGAEHAGEGVQAQMQRCQIGTLGERLDPGTGAFLKAAIYSRNIMRRHAASMGTSETPRPETTKEQRAHFAMHAHMQFRHEHLPAILAVWGDGTPRTVELTEHQPEEDFRNGSPEKVEQDIMLLERLIRDRIAMS